MSRCINYEFILWAIQFLAMSLEVMQMIYLDNIAKMVSMLKNDWTSNFLTF